MTDYETCQCSVCVARRESNYRSQEREQVAEYLRQILGREPSRFDVCDCGPCTIRRDENIEKALRKITGG